MVFADQHGNEFINNNANDHSVLHASSFARSKLTTVKCIGLSCERINPPASFLSKENSNVTNLQATENFLTHAIVLHDDVYLHQCLGSEANKNKSKSTGWTSMDRGTKAMNLPATFSIFERLKFKCETNLQATESILTHAIVLLDDVYLQACLG